MSIFFSICTGPKDFIIDIDGMRRNYTKNKRTIHTTKSSIKSNDQIARRLANFKRLDSIAVGFSLIADGGLVKDTFDADEEDDCC